MAEGALAGRTIQEVEDMTLQEQLYLFERARRLKERHSGGAIDAAAAAAPPLCIVADADVSEKAGDHDETVYLMFMEGSTRTRESFRNAAEYHGVKVNEFQAETSSFQKNETITDAMKMLSVYSTKRTVFVIRSPLEGVCCWLQTTLPLHAEKFGIPRPAFLNAGDGRHTHPVGEMVDEFSLLEQMRWDNSAIHIALVGDLAHGRTAHSKVDGLKVFRKVRVDLVAPGAFAYPVEYRNKMHSHGFDVRVFGSVEEYLEGAADSLANIWYFYQCQFKRCGELEPGAKDELLRKVTFREEWQPKLPVNASFFQTLPRDKEKPLIPLAFDSTPLNAWDRHASNAYYAHVVLLGMLFGRIGHGIPLSDSDDSSNKSKSIPKVNSSNSLHSEHPFAGPTPPSSLPIFLEAVDITSRDNSRQPGRARPGGTEPIADGLVVDHIGRSPDSTLCWRQLRLVRHILGWSKYIGSEGVYESTSQRDGHVMKGIMSLPNFDFTQVSVPEMKVLASVAPGCTINAIKGSKVINKYRLLVPERIYNLPNICCRNHLCVSAPANRQRDVIAYFERAPFYETSALPGCQAAEYLFVCKYCKWPHRYEDIWTDGGEHHFKMT